MFNSKVATSIKAVVLGAAKGQVNADNAALTARVTWADAGLAMYEAGARLLDFGYQMNAEQTRAVVLPVKNRTSEQGENLTALQDLVLLAFTAQEQEDFRIARGRKHGDDVAEPMKTRELAIKKKTSEYVSRLLTPLGIKEGIVSYTKLSPEEQTKVDTAKERAEAKAEKLRKESAKPENRFLVALRSFAQAKDVKGKAAELQAEAQAFAKKLDAAGWKLPASK